jgi:ribose transport system substrate-binding protein/inositol transport system substrate-binding protein
MRKYTRRLVVASALALTVVTAPVAHAEDQILASVPGLTFPFFVHMMNAFKAEIVKQGYGVIKAAGLLFTSQINYGTRYGNFRGALFSP